MSEEPAAPRDAGSKRAVILYSVAFGLLLFLGAFCWLLLAPYLRTRAAVERYAKDMLAAERIKELGGPAKASRGLALYLRLPERWAPHRQIAALLLGYCGECGRSAVPLLIKRLGDQDELMRKSAADALGMIGDPRAIEPLAAILKDRSPGVRCIATRALGNIDDPRAVEPLIALLKEPYDLEGWMVPEAIEALGKLKSPLAVEPLIAALEDKSADDEYVRARAAEALGKINDYRAVPALFVALGDRNRYVHRRSWAALMGMTDPRSAPHFIAALKSTNWEARSVAAHVLGGLGDHSAIEPLKQRLKDKDENVRRAAKQALERLQGAAK